MKDLLYFLTNYIKQVLKLGALVYFYFTNLKTSRENNMYIFVARSFLVKTLTFRLNNFKQLFQLYITKILCLVFTVSIWTKSNFGPLNLYSRALRRQFFVRGTLGVLPFTVVLCSSNKDLWWISIICCTLSLRRITFIHVHFLALCLLFEPFKSLQ